MFLLLLLLTNYQEQRPPYMECDRFGHVFAGGVSVSGVASCARCEHVSDGDVDKQPANGTAEDSPDAVIFLSDGSLWPDTLRHAERPCVRCGHVFGEFPVHFVANHLHYQREEKKRAFLRQDHAVDRPDAIQYLYFQSICHGCQAQTMQQNGAVYQYCTICPSAACLKCSCGTDNSDAFSHTPYNQYSKTHIVCTGCDSVFCPSHAVLKASDSFRR